MAKESKKLVRANLDMVHVHENPEFGKIEVIVVDEQTYFPADDCAKMLGYSYPPGAIEAYCRAKQRFLVPALGGNKQVDYILKDDLSRLIAESEILNARQFEKWVFGEVVRSVDDSDGQLMLHQPKSPAIEQSQRLRVFENQDFGDLQVIMIDGNPYFPATGCAKILGYNNPHKAIIDHCRYLTKREVPHPQSPSKTIEANFIPEADLYRLIAKSKLPAAEKFERWIFEEVLPSIRKHGMYATEELLDNPEFAAKVFTKLHEERQQRIALEAKVEQDKPLVKFANIVGNTSKLITMSEMAKMLCSKHLPIGRNRLFEKLRNKGILMQNNEPYQRYVDSGHFVVRDVIKGDLVYPQTMITGKGQKFIVDCLQLLSSGEEQPEAVASKI